MLRGISDCPYRKLRPVHLKKSVCAEIINDFRIRVKWVSEARRPAEAALQVDPG